MPSKKKKYNARFPAGRIKKIMQTDEEVGKVAQAVPVIISRTLELFVESLLTKSMQITQTRNAKTLTPSHMKQCILSESRFDFLKDLVKDIPDVSSQEDDTDGNPMEAGSTMNASVATTSTSTSSTVRQWRPNRTATADLIPPPSPPKVNISPTATSSATLSPPSQPLPQQQQQRLNFSINSLIEPDIVSNKDTRLQVADLPPPLVPITHSTQMSQGHHEGNLCIDEDYDN